MSAFEDETRAWVRFADEDLRVARILPGAAAPPAGPAAYHCQQAAEKALKAVLVRHGVEPERTHDLRRITSAVLMFEPGLRDLVGAVVHLTDWGVAFRYPDIEDEPSIEPEEVRAVLPALDGLLAAVRARPS